MDGYTLKIDEKTRDLVFDDDGCFEEIYGDESSAQAVRLTLLVYKGEFPLDITHGTDYDRIMGQPLSRLPQDEIEEILREAIFQEEEVLQIDSMGLTQKGRSLSVSFVGTLKSGKTIKTETEVD